MYYCNAMKSDEISLVKAARDRDSFDGFRTICYYLTFPPNRRGDYVVLSHICCICPAINIICFPVLSQCCLVIASGDHPRCCPLQFDGITMVDATLAPVLLQAVDIRGLCAIQLAAVRTLINVLFRACNQQRLPTPTPAKVGLWMFPVSRIK